MADFNTVCAFLLFVWAGNWYFNGRKIKNTVAATARKAAGSEAGRQIGGALLSQALKRINKY